MQRYPDKKKIPLGENLSNLTEDLQWCIISKSLTENGFKFCGTKVRLTMKYMN